MKCFKTKRKYGYKNMLAKRIFNWNIVGDIVM